MVTASDQQTSLSNTHSCLAKVRVHLTCNSTVLWKGCLQGKWGQESTAKKKFQTQHNIDLIRKIHRNKRILWNALKLMSPQKFYFYTFKLLCCWFVKHYKCICINGAGWGKIFECDMVSRFYGSLISSHLNSRIKWFCCMDTCLELETLWTYVRSPQDAAKQPSTRAAQLSQCCISLGKVLFFFFFLQERRKHMVYFKTLQSITERQFWSRLLSVYVVPSDLKRNKGYFHTIFWITVQITLKQLKRSSFELMDEKLHWIILIMKIAVWLTGKGRFSYFG